MEIGEFKIPTKNISKEHSAKGGALVKVKSPSKKLMVKVASNETNEEEMTIAELLKSKKGIEAPSAIEKRKKKQEEKKKLNQEKKNNKASGSGSVAGTPADTITLNSAIDNSSNYKTEFGMKQEQIKPSKQRK